MPNETMPDDPILTARFQTLRRDDERRCPPFAQTLAAARPGPVAPPRRLHRWAVAAGLVGLLGAGLLWTRLNRPAASPLADWHAPTDVLLAPSSAMAVWDADPLAPTDGLSQWHAPSDLLFTLDPH